MSAVARLLAFIAAVALTAPVAAPQPAPPVAAEQKRPAEPPHRPGELQCQNCHVTKHQGVLQMYLGMGGRGSDQGTPGDHRGKQFEGFRFHGSSPD